MKQIFFGVVLVFLLSQVTCAPEKKNPPSQESSKPIAVQGLSGKIWYVWAQAMENLTTEIQELRETVSMSKKNQKTSHSSLFCGVGIKDGRIPNSAMTASSHYRGSGNAAYRGRLDNLGNWHPASGQFNGAWLQVDLGKSTRVIGVITQGRYNWSHQWIKTYKIYYGETSRGLKPNSYRGHVIIYQGNRDSNSKVTNFFYQPITARYFRLVAVTFHAVPCLRLEYLVC